MADIRALYADEDGNILDAPKGFQALARTGTDSSNFPQMI